jgi:hypothetical protein
MADDPRLLELYEGTGTDGTGRTLAEILGSNFDNATASMKAVRDEVAAWRCVDDRDSRVRFVVEQERANEYGVRSVVEHVKGES